MAMLRNQKYFLTQVQCSSRKLKYRKLVFTYSMLILLEVKKSFQRISPLQCFYSSQYTPYGMHIFCISSVYSNPIRQSYEEQNYHKTRYLKGCQVFGIPNQLYPLAESKSYFLQGSLIESDFECISSTNL